MMCKKDVLTWFKELESYKRIDTMCSLLIVCLPFELRFLGTCLEELGRRDSLELRGMELRANNPQDLAADMVTCQKGEPTDIKTRRKMALYLALIRACNRSCVSEIFRTLECWGERDFTCMNDKDTLLELLLVYTMAANHPVFSFHQQTKCTTILKKIKMNKLVADELVQHQQHTTSSPPVQTQADALLLKQQPPIHQMAPLPPQQHLLQMLPPGLPIFSQPISKMIASNDGTAHHLSVDGMSHMLQSNITIPAEASAMLAHTTAAAPTWTLRQYAPIPQQQPPTGMEHQPVPVAQASSPMLSQQSSPSSSRTTSPNRGSSASIPLQQQQQPPQPQQLRNLPQVRQLGGGGGKHMRRPSAETTPPPMSNVEVIMPAQHIKHMDDSNDGGNTVGTSLPNLIRNGYPRTVHHRMKSSGTYIPPHQQQQQQSPVNQQQPQHFQTGGYVTSSSGLLYNMQNMNISDDGQSSNSIISLNSCNKSVATTTGSDSGSSHASSGECSPPETPTPLHGHNTVGITPGLGMINTVVSNVGTSMGIYQQQQPPQLQKHPVNVNYKQLQQLNLQQRLNGRNGVEKSYQQNYPLSTTNVVSEAPQQTNSSANAPPQQQQLLINPSAVSTPQQPTLPTPYNAAATYSYHAATARGPPPPQTIIQAAHNTAAPPPHNSFRFLQPPHNGELPSVIYPAAYHALTYLSVQPPAAPPAGTPGGNVAAVVTAQQQLRQTPTAVSTQAQNTAQQQTQTAPPTPTATPYSALSVCPITGAGSGAPQKNISCYNCGSQTHSGRDCQEASMEDVTRSATYKLDYTVTASEGASTAGNMGVGSEGGSGVSIGGVSDHKDNLLVNTALTTPTTANATAVATVTSSGK